MHIAIFIYGLTWGGATRRILSIADGFSQKGHHVDIVMVQKDGPLAASVPKAIRLVNLDMGIFNILCRKGSRKLKMFCSQMPLARYLRNNLPDVLFSAANHANLAAIGARKLSGTGIPLVIRVSNHLTASLAERSGLSRKIRYKMACRTYRQAEAVIAVSHGVAQDVELNAKVAASRITTIYNPTYTPDLIEKASVPLVHPWAQTGSPPVILGAGRLAAGKDFITLVKAFASVRKQCQAHLVILGEGKQRGNISRSVKELGIEKDVYMPGYVDNPLAWMANASVFVLSSKWEGLPGVLIEAMAAGCPVVSTRCPSGPAEILENGRYGRLVPVSDYQGLAKAIIATLESPPDAEKLRKRAAEFSVGCAVDRYLDVLSGVARK